MFCWYRVGGWEGRLMLAPNQPRLPRTESYMDGFLFVRIDLLTLRTKSIIDSSWFYSTCLALTHEFFGNNITVRSEQQTL